MRKLLKATMNAIRPPPAIAGMISGSVTRRNAWTGLAPSERAACSRFGSMPRMRLTTRNVT